MSYANAIKLHLANILSVTIRCLAHVINLATQALIKGYSKSKHYDPSKPDDHIPDINAELRDEVGLVRAIAVKVNPMPTHLRCVSDILNRSALRPNAKNFFEQYS